MGQNGRFSPPQGTPKNVWNNVATGVATNGNVVDTLNQPFLSIYGHVGGNTTLTVMFSADNSNFYASGTTIVFAGGAADFGVNLTAGARYVTLQSSGNVTATATIQAKG
jgi:hypothetical protein